ncbi:MAG: hypothetical protein HY647_08115 [Acidobacteria bacterium]|nr:hypothetical protein [Acidobacteriota bacterium]
MSHTQRILSIGLVCLLLVGVARAQEPGRVAAEFSTPRWLQFSGVVKDSLGQPRAGVVGLTFALYPQQEGGAALWLETQNVSLDEQGLYTVLLGSTKAEGLPLELFTTGEARWLGIQSRDSDGAVLEEQSRILLVSVPYALKAADAETLGGRPLSAFVLASEVVTQRVKESGGLTVAALSSDGSDGPITPAAAGDTGYIVKFTNDTGGIGRSVLFEDGNGRIGLGTTSPAAHLDVTNTIRALASTPAIPASGKGVEMYYESGVDAGFLHAADRAVPTFKALQVTGAPLFLNAFYGMQFQIASDPKIHLDASGNVGIGTTEPNELLEIAGSGRVFIGDGAGASRKGLLIDAVEDGTYVRLHPYNYGTAASMNLVISPTGGGNVGIGTTSPGQKLTVAGTIESTSGGVKFPDSTTQTTAMRTAALTRAITFIAGCEWCGTLDDAYDQPKIYYNLVGAMTINSVTCFSDTGTPLIQIAKNGTNILSSNLTCSPSGATTTSFSNNALSLYDFLDFVMVTAGGAAHRVTVTIQATIN